MADGTPRVTSLRIASPILEDVAYLARRMRSDEVAQFLAFSGLEEYDPDIAARAFSMIGGETYVLVDGAGLPVLLGGLQAIRPGVLEGWQVGTDAGWARHWYAITRITRRINDQALARKGVHRLQICARAGRDKTFEWYERGLGYRREATLARYCANGEDAVMFTRTKP